MSRQTLWIYFVVIGVVSAWAGWVTVEDSVRGPIYGGGYLLAHWITNLRKNNNA